MPQALFGIHPPFSAKGTFHCLSQHRQVCKLSVSRYCRRSIDESGPQNKFGVTLWTMMGQCREVKELRGFVIELPNIYKMAEVFVNEILNLYSNDDIAEAKLSASVSCYRL